ncbi:short-chain dehydrogenase [Rhexocercosporidium sp. MPI-PUGE-AT-0058]|nr:short-chain dehydrogenase [Rhexocercosporidium sp. MPI-PUGE-AT-0058]
MVDLKTFFPPKPTLTEKTLPDQSGKVFIVTGGASGLGFELVNILYARNGKVYLAGRSKTKALAAIKAIETKHPGSTGGQLIFLHLDLNDLSTIRKSADEFLVRENRLDVLFNNAGVMVPPQGSKTVQGYELQLGTNNLAPFLFTSLLTPLLASTAKTARKDSVRVVWVSSSAVITAPKPAVDFDNMDYHREEGLWTKYSRSKAGLVIYAAEMARRTSGKGIISVSLDPGFFKTNLQRSTPTIERIFFGWLSSSPVNGACTELFAGLDQTVTEAHNGGWIAPYGRLVPARKDLVDPEIGREYWEWSEEQVKPYRN